MDKHYFFCGIGGIGMSSLAAFALNAGHRVSGSDRSYDAGQFPEKFAKLKDMGITLYPQDGSGVTKDVDFFVTSTAVEPHIPDVKAALDLDISILKRAEYLAQHINHNNGITIAGTSGKSSVTAMTGHIFHVCGLEPNVLNGAVLLNNYGKAQLGLGNTLVGQSDIFIAEACESDGTIVTYKPDIALLHNVTLDHKDLDELRSIFEIYLSHSKNSILLNIDDHECQQYQRKFTQAFTYSVSNAKADLHASNILFKQDGVAFTATLKAGESAQCELKQYGEHNVSNALAAIACAVNRGIELQAACDALSSFVGIKSRMEFKGTSPSGLIVIDDYAHNPDKIEATIKTANAMAGNNIFVYQPHGFGPTKMLKDGYIETFSNTLIDHDALIMAEIFYAGGTADKSISSLDLVNEIKVTHENTFYAENKDQITNTLKQLIDKHDYKRVVIMGARDDSLREYAQKIVQTL